jgi:D-glycero-D-manno-heptose 1,7-bisphosphate phosphatase
VIPAVFLDRDGTVIEDVGYLDRVEDITFFPWTVSAIRALNLAGLPVVIVTNQSGIARGYFTETWVETAHREIAASLARGGARIDAFYYCPHHPEGSVAPYAIACDCRKPGVGMIQRAARDLGIDPAQSFVVGDKWLDIGAARAAGARGILVRTGYGATEETRPLANLAADVIVNNLAEAASWVLLRTKEPKSQGTTEPKNQEP